jgi:hypothetical protein
MEGLSSAGRRRIVQGLHLLSTRLPSSSASPALLIQASAQRISMFKAHLAAITAMLDAITHDNSAVAALRKTRGIATVTASTLVAEIIDIRRFASEDNLACYAGLGRREHSTGQNSRMVPSSLFNHRLKDAFMTAARNVVRFNPVPTSPATAATSSSEGCRRWKPTSVWHEPWCGCSTEPSMACSHMTLERIRTAMRLEATWQAGKPAVTNVTRATCRSQREDMVPRRG